MAWGWIPVSHRWGHGEFHLARSPRRHRRYRPDGGWGCDHASIRGKARGQRLQTRRLSRPEAIEDERLGAGWMQRSVGGVCVATRNALADGISSGHVTDAQVRLVEGRSTTLASEEEDRVVGLSVPGRRLHRRS